MKLINKAAVYALAAYTVLALTACPKTDNGSNNTAAATPATTCTTSYDGTLRDQYGRSCTAGALGYGCSGYTYNAQTGTYINPANGQQIPAAQCGGTNVIPNQGYYGSNYASNCQQWTQYYQQQGYNVTYVPVNLGDGTLVCVNYAYVQPQIVQTYSGYGYSPYNDPNYWYQYPPSAYGQGYNTGAYGGGYGGYGYGCATNVNLGFSTGSYGSSFGAGINLCF